MRLLTWNLNGLAREFLDERTEAAVFLAVTGQTLRELAKSKGRSTHAAPDVLLFQEVVDKTFHAHLRPHLERGGYTLYPPGPPGREQFELVAVRAPAKIADARTVALERSRYGRELTVVTVEGIEPQAGRYATGQVRVLTAHFDSGRTERAIRIAQIRQVAAAMDARSVFGGDTNLRATEWDAERETLQIADAWEALGKPDVGRATWRMHERTARFDRIWLGADLTPTALTVIGTAPLPGYDVLPSDHVGLIVDLVVS